MSEDGATGGGSKPVGPGPAEPGDDALPGTVGTGENVCPECNGSGEVRGQACANCGGTGKVIEGIGGG